MPKKFLQKTFHIRDGELKLALLMQLYIFIIITVLLLVKPAINALFLTNLGAEQLPVAYVLVALMAVLTSVFYNRLLKWVNIKKVAIISLVFFSLSFLLLSYLLNAEITDDYILYAYYLGVSLFGVLVTSQFWLVANLVYNSREAKRLFGFIGAGAIAGGIFGGYLTSFISNTYGTNYVILVAAILILFCIPILLWVWNHRIHNTEKIVSRPLEKTKGHQKSILRLIQESKHLKYLALSIGISVIMAKLVDYQFSDFAHLKIRNPHELASFFGFWFSTFNVISLTIQLFLTNRILEWLGVTTSLLILPLAIAIGCFLFLIFPELWVLILLKGKDTSFKQSVNKAAVELSIMPIPYEDKKQAKSFIDVVIDSIATGIAGFLLIFIVKRLDLHSHYITVLILFLLFVWILLVYQLREAYFDSFKNNILKAVGHFDINGLKNNDKPIHSSVIKILTEGSEKEIIDILKKLGDSVQEIHEPYILNLLDHESNLVKAAAIKEIYFFKHDAGLHKIKNLVETNNDPEVIYEAMEYLLLHTSLNDNLLFEDYLDHEKKFIADAALLCLAELSMDNKYLVDKFDLFGRIERKIKDIRNPDLEHSEEEIAEFLVTVGYARNSKFFSFIQEHLTGESTYILEHAIKAAGFSQDVHFIKPIVRHLGNDELRDGAVMALQRFGPTISQFLLELDEDEQFENQIRKYFPKVIASIRSKDSLKLLMRLGMSSDPYVRFEAAKTMVDLHLKNVGVKLDKKRIIKAVLKECEFYMERLTITKTLSKSFQEMNLKNTELHIQKEKLIGLLKQEMDYSMNIIFEVLSLVLNEDDMEIAYFGLKDESETVKTNAVEFLDNLIFKDLKANLIPLLEHHFVQEKDLSELTGSDAHFDSESNCLIALLKDSNTEIRMEALNIIALLEDKTPYLQTLKLLTINKNRTLSEMAENILNSIQS